MSLPVFLIPIVVGLAAQILKHLLNRNRRFFRQTEAGLLPRYGGMPSAHTAFVFSLATLVAYFEGLYSVQFAVVAAFVLFILDDALRMRIFLGHHGQALSQLIKRLPEAERAQYPQLETHLGHKSAEVTVGALVGIFLTLALLHFLPFL